MAASKVVLTMLTLETLCPNCMSSTGGLAVCNTCGDQRYPQYPTIALPAKTVLKDRFWVGRVLGRPGGFGVTYLAWDSVLDTTAAIKEYLPLHSASRASGDVSVLPNSEQDREFFQEGLRIFLQEAKTLAQFSHPNIVRIRDYFTANNTAYLVMDYHKGIPFDQYVGNQGGKLSEDRALELMLPILDGLESVHKKNFLHRDIKPQNIYLTDEGVPILLDFGAARYAMVERSSTLTVMLTAGFAPFEQYHRKGKQGPWSDIYACAATLYYLVTGKVPADALERKHSDTLVPPIELNPALSESLNMAIMKAMSVDYMARPRSVSGFKRLLLNNSFYHPRATEIIDYPVNNDAATVLAPSVRNVKIAPPERSKPSVIIRYESEKKGRSATRLVLFALLAAALYFYWNGRQLPNRDGGAMIAQTAISSAPDTERNTRDEAQAYPNEQYGEANREVAELPQRIVGEPSMSEERQYVEAQPQTVERQPEVNANARPLPPAGLPKPPEQAYDACRQQSVNAGCRFNTPFGLQSGVCRPMESRRLVCVPHGMPVPPQGQGNRAFRSEPMRPDNRDRYRNFR